MMDGDCAVIVFASQKGGSGKTTLSGHIAVAAQAAGAGPVALIDTDPQGSLAKWWNVREAEMPVFVETAVGRLGNDLKKLKKSGLKLIVIDTPPAATEAIAEVVEQADLVVVPTRPSPHDLRAVGVTVDIVEAAGKPLVFVVNCATARARITSETAVSLSQHGTVAPITLHNRVDFAASMIDGRTVGEVSPNSRSAKEVNTLWSYLEGRIARLKPKARETRQVGAPRFEVDMLTPLQKTPTPVPTDEEALHDEEEAALPPVPPPPPVRQVPRELPPTPMLRAVPIEALLEDPIPHAAHSPHVEAPEVTPAEQMAAAAIWDGIERRRRDVGPPPVVAERRRGPVFGRRSK